MARATKADKARLLNAAYRLLGQQMERAEAARQLGRECALSRRQAYRYLQEAAGLSAPLPAVEPTVAVTFKLPVSTVRAIRACLCLAGGHARSIYLDCTFCANMA